MNFFDKHSPEDPSQDTYPHRLQTRFDRRFIAFCQQNPELGIDPFDAAIQAMEALASDPTLRVALDGVDHTERLLNVFAEDWETAKPDTVVIDQDGYERLGALARRSGTTPEYVFFAVTRFYAEIAFGRYLLVDSNNALGYYEPGTAFRESPVLCRPIIGDVNLN